MVRETYGDYVLDFFYDQNGYPFMLLQNGNIYYYITNAQGDVIRLVDINGNVAASYRYDPYGKATSALGSHANINPLRYRGYVFDHETGLYYLQSRYYDPEIGRFINADALVSTGQGLLGNNMFAYCLNNPVSMADINGKDAIYVVDTNSDDETDGLAVVGHARAYLQDEEGNWYVTEYTGIFPKFWTARVTWEPVKGSKYEEEFISILLGEEIDGVEYVYLSGDFSKSNEVAKAYSESKIGYGPYNLLVHNCLHFVKDVLSKGHCDNSAVNTITSFSPTIIPKTFYYELLAANSLGSSLARGSNYSKNLRSTIAEVCK